MLFSRFLIIFLSTLLICTGLAGRSQDYIPSDRNATERTRNLYRHLHELLDRGIMMGHQDDLAYGVGWKYESGRSDIRDLTGDYPAVYGWELGHLEIDQPVNLDSVPFNRMKEFIRQGFERGGVITISWHLNNPLNGKTAWDTASGTVASILPGGSKHILYLSWLDKLAKFLSSLKSGDGDLIPVLFRPFHELNGSWFWWGRKLCTPEQFKQLWRFTVYYLRDRKNLHHLLYTYNTDRFKDRADYLERYPGDEYVDLLGFDIYQRGTQNDTYMKELDQSLSMLTAIATEKNKIPALTEFGGPNKDGWWTDVFLKTLRSHRISYVLAWRNAGIHPRGFMEFYVPYLGHAAAENFIEFYKDEKTLFNKDIEKENIYR